MTKDEALQEFFADYMLEQFPETAEDYGRAFPSTSVPTDVKFPFMTYEFIDADFDDGDVAIVVNIWHRTESERLLNQAAAALKHYIAQNDIIVCDEGAIWVKAGTPFSQSLQDETDKAVRRRYINISLEFLTR